MAGQNTIVYADLYAAATQLPSAVAGSLARAAEDSLMAGQFDVALRPLSANEVRHAISEYPSGHERLAHDNNLILLDVGAMLAYAPYRARILLTDDPFEHTDEICEALLIDPDALRIRLHDALLSAHSVVALGHPAFDAVSPLLWREPEIRVFPATALRADAGAAAPILIVSNEDESTMQQVAALLTDAFPGEQFVPFESSSVFDLAWKAMVQLGIAQTSLPGTRLCDAWAGGVPVIQLISPVAPDLQRRRRSGQLSGLVVEHGKTGLLVSTVEELAATLAEHLFDALPALSVARGAKRGVDLSAEWTALLKCILQ